MDEGRIILSGVPFQLVIDRLCYQLIETYDRFENTCFVAIQTGGVPLVDRIVKRLGAIQPGSNFEYGKLDITFYRDDFRTRSKPLKASITEMEFLVEGKNVILVDDVLYTGRTVQAALTALNHYGRPKEVSLLSLVDRRFNRHLPIQSDYIGITIDAFAEAYVRVDWQEATGEDRILLFANSPA